MVEKFLEYYNFKDISELPKTTFTKYSPNIVLVEVFPTIFVEQTDVSSYDTAYEYYKKSLKICKFAEYKNMLLIYTPLICVKLKDDLYYDVNPMVFIIKDNTPIRILMVETLFTYMGAGYGFYGIPHSSNSSGIFASFCEGTHVTQKENLSKLDKVEYIIKNQITSCNFSDSGIGYLEQKPTVTPNVPLLHGTCKKGRYMKIWE